MEKIKVGILGATGIVGQRLVQLLQNHPYFELSELCAGPNSVGKKYAEAVHGKWHVSDSVPKSTSILSVKPCKPNIDCKLVFSALDSAVAGQIESDFAKAGYIVSSNSKNHRMDTNVPLLIPEVNANHLEQIKLQNTKGKIITNPNCSTTQLAIALKPLHDAYKIKKIFITTMQAISGAGNAGFSLDIQDNLIPYIEGEEDKIEMETLKLLGSFERGIISFPQIKVSASCNRVNVIDGHTESISLEFESKPNISEVIECLSGFNPIKNLNLPSSPDVPIIVTREHDRPQPKLDRMAGNGMSVVIGRVRECKVLDIKFTILGHNTIRGAAGQAIQNAELLYSRGLI